MRDLVIESTALTTITRNQIREWKKEALKHETLSSERLKAHFEENPMDLIHICFQHPLPQKTRQTGPDSTQTRGNQSGFERSGLNLVIRPKEEEEKVIISSKQCLTFGRPSRSSLCDEMLLFRTTFTACKFHCSSE
jgi:hypothetical protein